MPLPVEKQIVIIYAGTRGYIDGIDISRLNAYERGLYDFIEKKYPGIVEGSAPRRRSTTTTREP